MAMCAASLLATPVLAQPVPYQGYICPSLDGVYHHGEQVKNVGGSEWTLSIPGGSTMSLSVINWPVLSVKKNGNLFELICQTGVSGKTITATYAVSSYSECKVVPEINYPVFGCY